MSDDIYLVGLVDQFRAVLAADGYDVSETAAMIDVGRIRASKGEDHIHIQFTVARGEPDAAS